MNRWWNAAAVAAVIALLYFAPVSPLWGLPNVAGVAVIAWAANRWHRRARGDRQQDEER